MKTELVITTACEEETENLGTALAAVLEPGSVAGLCGNLGAGKTVIARGVARGLGIEDNITSPTFVIMNRYQCPPPRSAPFYHFDLYRNPLPAEFEELGFSDTLRGEGVCVVEWAENIPENLTEDMIRIDIGISKENDSFREIRITASEEKTVRLRNKLGKFFKLK